MLTERVAKILDYHDFEWCACRGCFDIAARKRKLLLLKVLDNIDSIQESQAKSLLALSNKLSANVSLVGTHTRYEKLSDNVIYERFDIPTFTPDTLDSILGERSPSIYSDRGGLFVEVSPQALLKARNKAGMTQQQLADAVGVTKKSIYEHESRKMKARYSVAMRIEKLLGEKVTVPFEHAPLGFAGESAPATLFEKRINSEFCRIGFAAYFIGRSPFNVIAEEKIVIVSDAEPNPLRIERKAKQLERFADVSKRPVVIISEEEPRTDLPAITAKQLKGMSARELRKLAGSRYKRVK